MSEASKIASVWGQVAHLLAANARVEAMRAENQSRTNRGEAIAYGEDSFFGEAGVMQDIAQTIGGIG